MLTSLKVEITWRAVVILLLGGLRRAFSLECSEISPSMEQGWIHGSACFGVRGTEGYSAEAAGVLLDRRSLHLVRLLVQWKLNLVKSILLPGSNDLDVEALTCCPGSLIGAFLYLR